MTELAQLEPACTLIAELEWVVEVLDRGGVVPVPVARMLIEVADEPERLGRFATAVRPSQLDELLDGLAAGAPAEVDRARARAVAQELHDVADEPVAALAADARLRLDAVCSALVAAMGHEPPTAPDDTSEVELVVVLAPGMGVDEAQRLADAVEAHLGPTGELVGYEFHAESRRLVLSVGGVAEDTLKAAVLPLLAHAGDGQG
ncbi:hypothetical protein DSM104299_01616 [Baekduia alba]|nr:hypothetical protein DSM104299_01616 [Baekduia alba]